MVGWCETWGHLMTHVNEWYISNNHPVLPEGNTIKSHSTTIFLWVFLWSYQAGYLHTAFTTTKDPQPGDYFVAGRADGSAQPGAGAAVASAHRAGAFSALERKKTMGLKQERDEHIYIYIYGKLWLIYSWLDEKLKMVIFPLKMDSKLWEFVT